MKAYYPRRAAAVQAAVEDACDRLDYEGSFLFDEHPDPWTVRRTCQDICRQLNGRKNIQAMAVLREDLPKDSLSDLTQALFCQEMHRRRCRRKRPLFIRNTEFHPQEAAFSFLSSFRSCGPCGMLSRIFPHM